MDLKYVRDDLYRKLNIEYPANAPLYIRQDVVQAINQALQTMQTSGGDYFTQEDLVVAIIANQPSYTMDQTIQRVLGPIRVDGGPILRELRTQSDYDAFNLLYLNGDTMDLPSGEPRGFFLDTNRVAGPDNAGVVLKLVPVPDTNGNLLLKVVKECQFYTAEDFCDDPVPVPPCPHQYVETLLLPLARYYVSRSHWFTKEATEIMYPKLQTDYEAAMRTMGLLEPVPNATRKTNPQMEDAS